MKFGNEIFDLQSATYIFLNIKDIENEFCLTEYIRLDVEKITLRLARVLTVIAQIEFHPSATVE